MIEIRCLRRPVVPMISVRSSYSLQSSRIPNDQIKKKKKTPKQKKKRFMSDSQAVERNLRIWEKPKSSHQVQVTWDESNKFCSQRYCTLALWLIRHEIHVNIDGIAQKCRQLGQSTSPQPRLRKERRKEIHAITHRFVPFERSYWTPWICIKFVIIYRF